MKKVFEKDLIKGRKYKCLDGDHDRTFMFMETFFDHEENRLMTRIKHVETGIFLYVTYDSDDIWFEVNSFKFGR